MPPHEVVIDTALPFDNMSATYGDTQPACQRFGCTAFPPFGGNQHTGVDLVCPSPHPPMLAPLWLAHLGINLVHHALEQLIGLDRLPYAVLIFLSTDHSVQSLL